MPNLNQRPDCGISSNLATKIASDLTSDFRKNAQRHRLLSDCRAYCLSVRLCIDGP